MLAHPIPPTNAHSIIPIFSKLCRCFGYCLKMCMWFGHYPTHLTTINTVFHPCDKSILISNKNIILNICKTIFRHRFFFLIQYMLFGLNLYSFGFESRGTSILRSWNELSSTYLDSLKMNSSYSWGQCEK